MDLPVLSAFTKHALSEVADEDMPPDYLAVHSAIERMFPGLEKRAFSSSDTSVEKPHFWSKPHRMFTLHTTWPEEHQAALAQLQKIYPAEHIQTSTTQDERGRDVHNLLLKSPESPETRRRFEALLEKQAFFRNPGRKGMALAKILEDPEAFKKKIQEAQDLAGEAVDSTLAAIPMVSGQEKLGSPEMLARVADRLEKVADWAGFKEGLRDEGIPLAGATLGAGVGEAMGHPLIGGALGYAAGAGASALRAKLKKDPPSEARNVLAASGAGYGAGGLTHVGLGKALGSESGIRQILFSTHEPIPHGIFNTPGKAGFLRGLVAEGLPAAGAVLGTGLMMSHQRNKENKLNQAAASTVTPEIPHPTQGQA